MADYKEMRKEIEEYRKEKHINNKFKDSKTVALINSSCIEIKGNGFNNVWNWASWDKMVRELDKNFDNLNK